MEGSSNKEDDNHDIDIGQFAFNKYVTNEHDRLTKEGHIVQKNNEFRKLLASQWKLLKPEDKAKYKDSTCPTRGEVNKSDDEIPKIQTRCSPHQFQTVVSKFSKEQVAAISELGFGTLLQLSCTRIRRDLCAFLVDKFDTENSLIELHGTSMDVTSEDFHLVMGVPEGGSNIDLSGSLDDPDMKLLASNFVNTSGNISIADLSMKLKETKTPCKHFEITFILFTLGTLLCPSTCTYISKRYLLAFKDMKNIKTLNWASYVFGYLKDNVRGFKEDSSKYICGCVLFLQLFYCNAIGYGRSLVDCSKPIVAIWNDEQSSKLVKWVLKKGSYSNPKIMVARNYFNTDINPATNSYKEIRSDIEFLRKDIVGVHMKVDDIQGYVRGIHEMFQTLMGGRTRCVNITSSKKQSEQQDTHTFEKSLAGMESDAGMRGMDFSKLDGKGGEGGMGGIDFSEPPKVVAPLETLDPLMHNRKLKDTTIKKQSETHTQAFENDDDEAYIDSLDWVLRPQQVQHKSPINTRNSDERRPSKVLSSPFVQQLNKIDEKSANYMKWIGPFKGPFNFDDEDGLLLCHVYGAVDDDDAEIFITEDTHLTREEFRCLEPDRYLNNMLISAMVRVLRGPYSTTDRIFTPWFSGKAINCQDETALSQFVSTAKERHPDEFSNLVFDACKKFFVPILDVVGSHWYLMVVKFETKEVEIWDSLPDHSDHRITLVKHMLKTFDMIFEDEILYSSKPGLSFSSFEIVTPSSVPRQPNGCDCGIFVLKFLEDYENATKFGKTYDSTTERLRIALFLLKHPDNQALETIVEDMEEWREDKKKKRVYRETEPKCKKKLKTAKESNAEGEVPIKRTRGRPPNSKNKPKK